MKWLRGSLIVAVAGSTLGAALPAQAQASRDMPRIGVLVFTPMTQTVQDEFRQAFRDHGYVEGRNLLLEWRSAEGRTDRAKAMATELVKAK